MARPKKYKILETVFPRAPYVEKGHWSFCDMELQMVFPEICVFSQELQREIYSGVVIHPVNKEDKETIVTLTKKCQEFGIILFLFDENIDIDPSTIKEKILLLIESQIIKTS